MAGWVWSYTWFSWLQEGESSDEGEDPSHSGANEKEGVDSNYEYSEEETDEEVSGGCEGESCEGIGEWRVCCWELSVRVGV